MLLLGPRRRSHQSRTSIAISISCVSVLTRDKNYTVEKGGVIFSTSGTHFVSTRYRKNFEDMFTRFDRIHKRDGRTDRQRMAA